MPELLLEILSEEIPARMQKRAAADLRAFVVKGLKEERLKFESAEAYATPRRLALVVRGVPERQKDHPLEKKGPRKDAPKAAVEGFARSVGRKAEDLEIRETDKGPVYFFKDLVRGGPTLTIAAQVLGDAIRALPWPKSMRWADGQFRWVRPVSSVLATFGGEAVPLALEGVGGGDLEAGLLTSGHRFLAPGPLSVTDFDDYKKKLMGAKVMLDPAERRQVIDAGAKAKAKAAGLRLREDIGLLDEVIGLVEWPVPLLGTIDPEFLDLPPEVLVTEMRSHQKYFATEDMEGNLADKFVVVAGTEATDGGQAIVAGNERVLRARLADAKFFWDRDRKAPLASRAPALKEIVFHARLGTLDEKVDRTQALATELCQWIPGADRDKVRSAARLAKADLTTGMVGEFPELQGIMGRYYALEDGETEEVADAVAEHYAPKGPNDMCPTAPVSVAVALADKIDTLVQFWAIDEKPTGSKDPFALRRAALGVLRLVLENQLRLPLLQAFAAAGAQADSASELLGFFADRLKVHLREKGVRHDLIAAVFALEEEDDLVRLLARVGALDSFLNAEEGADLLTAYRRAANIVRIEEKKDGSAHREEWDAALLSEGEEMALVSALTGARQNLEQSLKSEEFEDAMRLLANLRAPVDAFFDNVTVNVDDAPLRANRLRLLSQITATLELVADFSEIEG